MTPSPEDQRLIDQYLSGEIDAAGFAALEDRLLKDEELRKFFVEYASFDTQLKLNIKSEASFARSLSRLQLPVPDSGAERPVQSSSFASDGSWLTVVSILAVSVLVGFFIWFGVERSSQADIAWVLNAQNCIWDSGSAKRGRFVEDQWVTIEAGLLEIGFDSQAVLLAQGPATFKICDENRIELQSGRVAVKMPKGYSGFEVLTPSGRVLDLGTEFGVSVDESGNVGVSVFDGEVMAYSKDESQQLRLVKNESASLKPEGIPQSTAVNQQFIRKIVVPSRLIENRFDLSFDEADQLNSNSAQRVVFDQNGKSVGLSRLDRTGGDFLSNDPNLLVDRVAGLLKVTATQSDINHQSLLANGEYFGVRLSELGFTGKEDFEVRLNVLDTPNLQGYAQYGLYVAESTMQCARGGVIRWSKENEYAQFLVNTDDGKDADTNQLGYISPGSDIAIYLRRKNGRYTLEMKDLESENSNTLQTRHPAFLDGCEDLQVGIFVANPFHKENHATVSFDSFGVSVWKQKESEE